MVARFLTLAAMAIAAVAALDKQLDGINFDLRQGPDWDPNKCKSDSTIASELKTLSAITKNVRTYSLSDCDVSPVLRHAKEVGVTVWLGVWVSGVESVFQGELAVAQKLIDAGLIDDNVKGFNVGSEAVYRKDIEPDKAIEYLKSFQGLLSNNSISKPTAITDIIDTFISYPDMLHAGDVVTINQFPFWEHVKPSEAGDQFLKRIQPLLSLANGKQVIITETGWPSAGTSNTSAASIASPAASARFLNDFILLAQAQNWKYYYFQGFDSPWKAQVPGEEQTVEANFGLFTKDGTMKPEIASLKVAKKSADSAAKDDAGQSQTGSAAGKTDKGGNGAVHGASTGGSGSLNPVTGKKSTKPSSNANNGTSGVATIGHSVLAVVMAVLAFAVYQ